MNDVKQQTADDLRAVLRVLKKRGHTRRTYERRKGGPVCPRGAMRLVAGLSTNTLGTNARLENMEQAVLVYVPQPSIEKANDQWPDGRQHVRRSIRWAIQRLECELASEARSVTTRTAHDYELT